MSVALDKMFHGPPVQNSHLHTNPIMDRNHYSSSGHGYHQNYHTSSHGTHKDGGKRSIALSALTLLAFLFFLNILQNCLQDQMETNNQNNGQQVLVLSSRLKSPRDADKRKDNSQDTETIVEDESSSVDFDENEQAEEKKYLQIAKRVLKSGKDIYHDKIM